MTGTASTTGTPAPRPRRRRPIALGLAALVALAAWGAGLAWFVSTIPEHVADTQTRTDAIVVLTGGADRLRTGLELLAAGKAEKLFVTGVYRGVDVARLLRVAEKTRADLACCIDLGHDARDTIGNAAETAAWMAAQGYDSLRLVTANYHLRRSLLEFRRAMPQVRVIPHPVFPPPLRQGRWWRPAAALLIIGEYDKYLLALVRHAALNVLSALGATLGTLGITLGTLGTLEAGR